MFVASYLFAHPEDRFARQEAQLCFLCIIIIVLNAISCMIYKFFQQNKATAENPVLTISDCINYLQPFHLYKY